MHSATHSEHRAMKQIGRFTTLTWHLATGHHHITPSHLYTPYRMTIHHHYDHHCFERMYCTCFLEALLGRVLIGDIAENLLIQGPKTCILPLEVFSLQI